MSINIIKGGVTAAKGFQAAYTEAGVKYANRKDMAMVFSKTPCVSAGTFTSNVVKAACVQWDMNIVKSDKPMHGMVINTGIANACTGKEGMDMCRQTSLALAKQAGIDEEGVLVASTGVIGRQLPMDKLEKGVSDMYPKLSETIEAGHMAAKAMA